MVAEYRVKGYITLTSQVIQEVIEWLRGDAVPVSDVGGDAGEGWAELVDLPVLGCVEPQGFVLFLSGDVKGVRIIDELPSEGSIISVVIGSGFSFGDLRYVFPGVFVSEFESLPQIFALKVWSLIFDICRH